MKNFLKKFIKTAFSEDYIGMTIESIACIIFMSIALYGAFHMSAM